MLHLQNICSFIKINYNTLEEIQIKINLKLVKLKSKKDISEKLFNNLIIENSKLGSFRILPKLHIHYSETRKPKNKK